MNFFKRAIAHILAITVALSGAMIASAKNLNKISKDKKDNHNYKKAAIITIGTTAIALPTTYCIYKCLTRPHGSQGLNREDIAKNIERHFIERINSYPTQKNQEDQKYIKLSPMMVGLGMLKSPTKRLNMNFVRTLENDVYINLNDAKVLQEYLLLNLCALYDFLHDESGCIPTPSDSSRQILQNCYEELATNHLWQTNRVADIYMELYNFYRYLSDGICNLELPIGSANEVELQGEIVDSREVHPTIERVCL